MKGNDRAVGRGRWCTDANKLSNQVSRGGRDERASHVTVELCACHGIKQRHVQRDVCNLSVPFNTPSRWDHGRTGLSPVRDPGLRPEPGAAQHGRSHALLNGQAL